MKSLIIPTDVKYTKILFIYAQSADPSPPLGTVLGNLGVNTINFCTQFNAFTINLAIFFKLRVFIFIYENRSTTFCVTLPTIGYILNLLKFEKNFNIRVFDRIHEKLFWCIKLYQLLKLAKLKFPNFLLQRSIPIILGTIKSMNLIVIR